ncbi:uncharacterized protein LOC112166359 isoform X1 [Rosa chinensis]|uniref:uncharacterized protein LOC112166359 isoform X1 n=1 Tax=Rosa chinensis TaxID=74649 RepID=UPI000D08B9C8|nr:uncharacterized protein LOC112166359 isoform X1 [Rosa chinensis]XP_024158954.1 uncharacterized protein LOC112166359 isoform X1 [Rosa chinensis]XP_024158955.1 uncharacterized protein LOC112166359 isoform X1 [Rosa chinensis]XP_024158956.1 uncharacterized protein LOC112166359 isoform X1 [Rosa chinensis]XP_040375442.1 uncharacterized protein LOC112166359 isoform X1 [Rosa chinensis]
MGYGHLYVEVLLFAVIVFLFSQKSYKPPKKPLTEKEIDDLCEEWVPEPLIPPITEDMQYEPPVLESAAGPHTIVNGKESTPLLTSPPSEGSLTDILVRKPSSSSAPSIVDPKVLLELFSMYREWQEENVKKLSQKQEEIENKIEIADTLSVKLKQRFNYSVTAMKTSSQHLCGVHALQVEIGELKGRLTEVISNCDAVCKRISAEGPESLRSSVKPLVVCTAHQEHQS